MKRDHLGIKREEEKNNFEVDQRLSRACMTVAACQPANSTRALKIHLFVKIGKNKKRKRSKIVSIIYACIRKGS